MKTLIIIPTYNERENLPLITEAIFEVQPTVDLLIVDDEDDVATFTDTNLAVNLLTTTASKFNREFQQRIFPASFLRTRLIRERAQQSSARGIGLGYVQCLLAIIGPSGHRFTRHGCKQPPPGFFSRCNGLAGRRKRS